MRISRIAVQNLFTVSTASLVRAVRVRKLQFSDSCQFPTQKFTDAQNFNFALQFPKMGNFTPKFCILESKFPSRRKSKIATPATTLLHYLRVGENSVKLKWFIICHDVVTAARMHC